MQNSCSYYFFRKKLENFFWTSSLLIQFFFQVFFQGFYLDFKLLLLLNFRFPRACVFLNASFSHPFTAAGLRISRQRVTRFETDVLLTLFTFLECLRLLESLIKIWRMMLMEENKVLDPTLFVRSIPGLVPEI